MTAPESVVLAGRTFLTVAGLEALDPKHPLLDRLVRHYVEPRMVEHWTLRDTPHLLVAELGRR